jgi:predicted DNA-binding transcriptional regulator AlpA
MRAAAEPPTLLLTARDAARALAISEKTLWTLSAPRGPIPTIRVGERSIRYSVAALEKWVAAQQAAEAESSNEHDGNGVRLVPATGYSPCPRPVRFRGTPEP